jgi:hypothetical protein
VVARLLVNLAEEILPLELVKVINPGKGVPVPNCDFV